jgi:hypothetical protein
MEKLLAIDLISCSGEAATEEFSLLPTKLELVGEAEFIDISIYIAYVIKVVLTKIQMNTYA